MVIFKRDRAGGGMRCRIAEASFKNRRWSGGRIFILFQFWHRFWRTAWWREKRPHSADQSSAFTTTPSVNTGMTAQEFRFNPDGENGELLDMHEQMYLGRSIQFSNNKACKYQFYTLINWFGILLSFLGLELDAMRRITCSVGMPCKKLSASLWNVRCDFHIGVENVRARRSKVWQQVGGLGQAEDDDSCLYRDLNRTICLRLVKASKIFRS